MLGLEADAVLRRTETKGTAGWEDEPVAGGRCTVAGPRVAATEQSPRQDKFHAPAPGEALLTPNPTWKRSGDDTELSECRWVAGRLLSAGRDRSHGGTGKEKRKPAFCR